MTFDPWKLTGTPITTPVEDGDTSTAKLEASFKPTLVKRARKRLPTIGFNLKRTFYLDGIPSLGDSYDNYTVTYIPETKKYECSCYHTDHGDTRRRRVCSHVLACMIYKRENGIKFTSDGEPATPTVPGLETPPEGEGVGDDGEGRLTLSLPSPEPTPNISTTVPAEVTVVEGDGGEGGTPAYGEVERVVLPSPSDPIFGYPGLPEWVEAIRPEQWVAVQEIVQTYNDGAKVVFLDAPTGSGKTLIAELVRRVLNKRASYICTTKTLQDQFMGDYPYAKLLKGRSNYPTLDMPFPEYTCADCTKTPGDDDEYNCEWCPVVSRCKYEVAKRDALMSPIAVLNTSYLITECNYVESFSGRHLGIVDECDTLEEQLMGFVEFAVTDRMLRRLNIAAPIKGAHKTTIHEWMKTNLLEALKARLREYPRSSPNVSIIRERQALERLRIDAARLSSANLDEWVRDNDAGPLVLKPVKVNDYGERYLWRHAVRWLCMSATIISSEEMADSLGLEGKYETVRVPMMFPVENRVINVAPVANMTNKAKAEAWPKAALAVANILDLHPETERVLVHTVSYELTRYLQDSLGSSSNRTLITYAHASERESALEMYRATPGSVLLAPSFERGVDLKNDDCRVVIVLKVPFPFLGDSQISTRLHTEGGETWYRVQTIRSLVQMTGRGVRSKEDWCVTYILDRQFTQNIWKRSKGLLPEWWVEALDMRYSVRDLLRVREVEDGEVDDNVGDRDGNYVEPF